MPQSPKVRFFGRPRARLVTGDRSGQAGSTDAARRSGLKLGTQRPRAQNLKHKLTVRHARDWKRDGPFDALCSCGWYRLNVTKPHGHEEFRRHQQAIERMRRRRQ